MSANRGVVVLALFVVYIAVVFLVRSLIQRAQTGSTGFRGISGKPCSPEWLAGVLFVVALVVAAAAPIADMMALLVPLRPLDMRWLRAVGYTLFGIGFTGTFLAQTGMGESWRIGVDARERTKLVTTGAFAWVRNPIFSAMLVTALGMTCILPNVPAIAAWTLLVIAIELQVRVVEEPYLLRIHGPTYAAYAARVGRFVPLLGKRRSGYLTARRSKSSAL